jgi:hypothetical protein
MTNEELKSLLQDEIHNSIGYLESETVQARAESMEYYMREKYGNEVEGRSQVVTGEVAEAVDGALPQLIRVFTSSEDAVQFEAEKDGDEPFAEQASEMANWVFYKDNSGFLILHNWFKDALLQKVGVVKAYWEVKKDITKEKYKYLSDDELAMIMMTQDYEIIKQTTEVMFTVDGMAYNSHDVTIQKTDDKSRIQIESVPPEEFLISKRAKTIEDSPFCAHRRLISRGDLVAMGYDKDEVRDIPSGDRLEYSSERLARYDRGEMPSFSQSTDTSMELVEVFECYIKVDTGKDGLLELRKVVMAGEKILEDEECDYVPFHSLCPIPVPHKFMGQSLADRTMDIQLTKSTILRQMLDNLYLTNNYRVGAVEGQVNLDDLLTSTAGGVVRMKNPNAIVPLTVANTAAQSFPMLDYLDQVQAKRTGVSDVQQGLDASILQNSTATAVSAMMQQSAGKLELMARIFAETGVKSLFRGILHLLCKYQDKAKTIKTNGKWVSYDPREWSNLYQVSINVGLGNGSRQEQIGMLQMIMAKQEEIIGKYGANNPLVTVTQYRKTLGRMIEMSGFKDTTSFINEITPEIEQQIAQQASQPPPPDPTSEAAQLYAKVEADKVQLAAQTAQAKMQLDQQKMDIQNQQKQLEFQQKQTKMEADYQLKLADLELKKMDYELKMESMMGTSEAAKATANAEIALKDMRLQLDASKANTEAEKSQAKSDTERYNMLLKAASEIVIKSMTLPVEQQGDAANSAIDSMPVADDDANVLRETVNSLLSISQNTQANMKAAMGESYIPQESIAPVKKDADMLRETVQALIDISQNTQATMMATRKIDLTLDANGMVTGGTSYIPQGIK